MSIKSKTAGWNPAATVNYRDTSPNYRQYTIGIKRLFLCDSILIRIGKADA